MIVERDAAKVPDPPPGVDPEDLLSRCLDVGSRLEEGDSVRDLLLALEDYVPAARGAKLWGATYAYITEALCDMGYGPRQSTESAREGQGLLHTGRPDPHGWHDPPRAPADKSGPAPQGEWVKNLGQTTTRPTRGGER
jgi:hypothetical protein